MADVITKETKITTGVTPSAPNPSTSSTPAAPKAEKSQTINYIIYFVLGLVEVLLAFRLILKLTGANPLSGFVSFIYSLTQIFIVPFTGIFPQATTQGAVTTAVFDPATLVAMVVYAVLAWGIMQLVVILSRKKEA